MSVSLQDLLKLSRLTKGGGGTGRKSLVLNEGKSDTSNADVMNNVCTASMSRVTSASKPGPPRKKIKVDPIARRKGPLQQTFFLSEEETPTIVKVWCEKLITLDPEQRKFAEKAINDVLFEASLGTLHRNSVTINSSSSLNNTSAPSPKQTLNSSCSTSLAVASNESSGEISDIVKDSTS